MTTYIIVLLSMMGLDTIWIGFISRGFYNKHLGYIFVDKFVVWPAVLFYAIYAFGVVYFVVNPALLAKSFSQLVLRAALFGLVAFATYDLSNQATIAKWPVVVTFADMAWGVAITTIASSIAYLVASKW